LLSELRRVPGFSEARRVFIDELQFFVDARSAIEEMLARGVKVYATGLNSTWERRPWSVISEVFALATRVEIRTAICHVCKADATYSMKLCGDKELVNFEDKQYDAACGICWKLYRTKEETALDRYVEPDLRASTADLETE
jgi:thymidine kinase